MKKHSAKPSVRKLVLRAEAITVLSSPQLAAVAGGQLHRNSDESQLSACSTEPPAPVGV